MTELVSKEHSQSPKPELKICAVGHIKQYIHLTLFSNYIKLLERSEHFFHFIDF